MLKMKHFFKPLTGLLFLLCLVPVTLNPGPERHWFQSQQVLARQFFLDYNCMVEALWFEARNDNEIGKRAVATVIINRANSARFNNTICDVIQQRKQFSYRNRLKNPYVVLQPKPQPSEKIKLEMIKSIAYEVASGTFKPVLPSNVLWYHTYNVNPSWNRKMKAVMLPGSKHVFLKGSDRG
jgi:spore germination cell wall hydrolase CwlJ-like protein